MGVVVATANNIAVSTPYGTQFYSGRIPGIYGDIRRLQGAVDEIRVYNRALLPSEIAALAISDSTPPIITPTVTGTLGSNGWYTGDVAVSWSVTDAESPISSSTGCDTSSVTSDTLAGPFVCSATSGGGTATQSVTVKRDATAPVVSIVSPTSGVYIYNQSIFVNYTCTDGGSLVASCAGTTANGALLDTGSIGSKTLTVNTTDNAGNMSSSVVNYTVVYRVPTNLDECKNGGWQTRQRANGTLFNNQGDCVSYVNNGN